MWSWLNRNINSIRWAHDKRNDGTSALYALVSIGEIRSDRSYARDMPAAMLAGSKRSFRAVASSINRIPTGLSFLLSVSLRRCGLKGIAAFSSIRWTHTVLSAGDDPAAIQAQQDGLVNTIAQVRAQFPDAQLITNRGFELLDRIKPHVRAMAAQSLFGRWNETDKTV